MNASLSEDAADSDLNFILQMFILILQVSLYNDCFTQPCAVLTWRQAAYGRKVFPRLHCPLVYCVLPVLKA
jgi:hypothetical protein